MLVTDPADGVQVGQIGQVDGQLDHVLHPGAGCPQRGGQVGEDLPSLGGGVGLAHDSAFGVRGNLAGDATMGPANATAWLKPLTGGLSRGRTKCCKGSPTS